MAENRLAKESSPYLLQHASNPVDWHAWGPEALKMARDKNRPIFLSVGYSSCHWCHVMAHESFENEEIARLLNENFVSIKVDREERPDIDDVYQRACQMASGQGGWPLSAFLTPDQKPFYVGTYFPPMDSYGRPGFGSLAARLAQSWKEKPSDVQAAAEKFAASLSREPEPAASPESPGQQALDEAAVNLLHAGDSTYGGFGQAPKFPSAANISFLFRYGAYSRVSKFHEFALMTLRRMARGGIFDQIGGGFHRYSTDARWLVPHFEKMLYDNALIPINYVEAYQITGDAFYLEVAQKTLDFVLREMSSPEGCFYSAYDADSKGGEGSFYTWKKSEVRSVLGDGPDFEAFCLYYDVTDGGNWESRTILCRSIADSAAAFKLGTTEQELREAMARCSARLLEARSARPMPGLDEKAITSWNALMISALTAGFCASEDGRYLDAAESCISFIEQKMSPQGRLLHTYKDGTAKIPGYLDDYAYYVAALLDAFGATAQARYLERAAELADEMLGQFWDGTAGFYTTSGLHEGLIARTKSVYDLSVPSGSSVAAGALLRLYHMDGSRRFLGPAEAAISAQSQAAAENPFGFGRLLCSMFDMVQEVPEVTVMDKQGRMSSQLYKRFLPGAAIVRLKSQSELDFLKGRAFFAGKEFSGKPRAYVCRGSACTPPITDAEQAAGLASPRRQP